MEILESFFSMEKSPVRRLGCRIYVSHRLHI